jgi:SAM-dependent methyltransferase
MKKINTKLKKILKLFGIGKIINWMFTMLRYPFFLSDLQKFKKLHNNNKQRFSLDFIDLYPCVNDKTTNTGFDRHYIFHTAWAARKVREINPAIHYDISSSLYFNAIVSAFVPIKFYDYRPATLNLSNLESGEADLHKLPFKNNSIESLSCMHVIEHIGLGRYGDPLDYDGDLKAIEEIKRVLTSGGNLLFVVPIGKNIIMYNAHRIYTYNQIISYFLDYTLEEFSLIPDDSQDGTIIENASEGVSNNQVYGCGMFWFKKLSK